MIRMRIGGGLLRRHVRRGPYGHAGGGQCGVAGSRAQGLGDTEVGDDRVMAGEEHVVRFDVTMHHPMLVGAGQGIDHVAEEAHRLADRELALTLETSAERLTLDVGHGEPEPADGFARVVHWEDVGMLQPGRDLDLPEKALRT